MAQTTPHDHYLAAFAAFEKTLNGQSSSPVHRLRKEAIERFADLGFPSTREEAWVNTSLRDFETVDAGSAGEDSGS